MYLYIATICIYFGWFQFPLGLSQTVHVVVSCNTTCIVIQCVLHLYLETKSTKLNEQINNSVGNYERIADFR